MEGLDEDHVTVPVISTLLPSPYWPAAFNCRAVPWYTVTVCGVMVMLFSAGSITVRLAVADCPSIEAVMVVVP
jgi:hypothetical protein